MRFDVNACFGHWSYWDLRHKTVSELLALMNGSGIDRAAVLSLRGVLLDWRAGNEETLAACARSDRLVPMATISPFPGGTGDELNRLFDAEFRGVRLYPTFHSYSLDDDFVDQICTVAAGRQAPVMIATRPMMNWRFKPLAIESLGAVAERHPQTQFILSGPNYLLEFQGLVRVMRRCGNIASEISCMQGMGGVKDLVDEVGAERVLFGTGAVLQYPACNVAKLDHAEITPEQRQAIFSENALRLLE